MITEDAEGGLFTVTLFRKVIDDFKTKARENKYCFLSTSMPEKQNSSGPFSCAEGKLDSSMQLFIGALE